jgi:DNA-binding SARP family transcriptional activator
LEEVLPEGVVGPAELRLTAAETAEFFANVSIGRVGELMELTEGWFGPLAVLRHHWPEAGGTVAEVVSGATVRHEIATEVLKPLPRGLRELITACLSVETLDPELWCLVWRRDAEHADRFAELFYGYRLHLGTPPRLPRVLRVALASPERVIDVELMRRLGTAAVTLGKPRLAAEIFATVGDSSRRQRSLGLARRDEKVEEASPLQRVLSSHYSLRLFGLSAVHRLEPGGGEFELGWRLRRAFETVAFLGLAPDHRSSKEELVGAVWPDASDRALAKNFHPTLSEARRTLGGARAILFRQGCYHLNPDIAWEVDVHQFETLGLRGRELLAKARGEEDQEEVLKVWQSAWRLFRGPLLQNHDNPWVEEERRRLKHLHLALLCDLGDLAARLHHRTLALDAYRSVLLEDPYEEHIHLAVMRLYAQQGRRDLVRRQYVRLQELLLDELSEEPSIEIREIYHRLMG